MTKQSFLKVLEAPTYESLLKLYNKYKIDTKRDKFYAGVYNDVNSMQYKMLLNDVKNIFCKLERNNMFDAVDKADVMQIQTKPLVIERKNIQRVRIDKNPHISYDALPDELKVLYNENVKLESEIKSKHAIMNALPPAAEFNDKRKILIQEISAYEEKQGKNWDVIDAWYAEPSKELPRGKTLPTDLPSNNEPVEISKYITRARKYIDRYGNSEKPLQVENTKLYRAGLKQLGINA